MMSATLNVNSKSGADSSPRTATKRHSKLKSQVRGLRRDKDEGRPELVQKKKKVGYWSNFVCRKLMMNAQGTESELMYDQYHRQQIGI